MKPVAPSAVYRRERPILHRRQMEVSPELMLPGEPNQVRVCADNHGTSVRVEISFEEHSPRCVKSSIDGTRPVVSKQESNNKSLNVRPAIAPALA